MFARYEFAPALTPLLHSRWRSTCSIVQEVSRAASIKDVIESFGPPHTEVGALLCNGREIDFSWPVASNQHFTILAIPPSWDVTLPTRLRPSPLRTLIFAVDQTAGRLARGLRMAGYDTLYEPMWTADELIEALHLEPRVLLSRNLDLLKRRQIVFGRALRTQQPTAQLREIFDIFGISQPSHPFTRCLDCNFPLVPITKEEIFHRLEPLTRRYYDDFYHCPHCDKIYWSGSHVERMRQILGGEQGH